MSKHDSVEREPNGDATDESEGTTDDGTEGTLSSHTTHPAEYEFSYDEVTQIVEATDHLMWVKNRDGEFVFTNEKFARNVFDLGVEELRGTTDVDHIDDLSEGEEEAFMADDLHVMDTGEPLHIPQEPIRFSDGSKRVLRTIKYPYETEITEQDATVGIAVDITNQVDSQTLVELHEETQELMYVQSRDDIAEIAIRAITDVLEQEYCTVWLPAEEGDRLELFEYSGAVGAHAGASTLERATAGPGDLQWEQYRSGEASVETNVEDDIDPGSIPFRLDEPLRSHVLVPVGEFALLEVGSFDQVLFKTDLPQIVASMMEAAFRRLEYERDFREISQEVDSTVADVDESTDEVATISESVTDRADDQVTTMEEVLDGVTKLNAAIEEIAATADTVDTAADEAVDVTETGKESADEARDVIDDATDSAEVVAGDVDELQSKIDEIDEIVDVINEIADQTNILALNASIEAARQGQAGNGFAVVANEVKALAEETQENATEIEALVDDVQQDADTTVESLTEMVNRIERGNELVDEAMEAFVEVADAITEVSHGVSEVADATDEQASSAEEISAQADQAAELASEVAAEADRIASANAEIADQVADLNAVVGDLTETN